MIHKPDQWPSASGVFNAPRTIVMTMSPRAETRRGEDTVLVATPLDLIQLLEDRDGGVITVVLTGHFALDGELAMFLREIYPAVELVVERPRVEYYEPATSMVA